MTQNENPFPCVPIRITSNNTNRTFHENLTTPKSHSTTTNRYFTSSRDSPYDGGDKQIISWRVSTRNSKRIQSNPCTKFYDPYDDGFEFLDDNFKNGRISPMRKTSLPMPERAKKYYNMSFETMQSPQNCPKSPVTSSRMIYSANPKQEQSEFGPFLSMVQGLISPKHVKPSARTPFIKIRKKIVDCNIKRNVKPVINPQKIAGWEESFDPAPESEIEDYLKYSKKGLNPLKKKSKKQIPLILQTKT